MERLLKIAMGILLACLPGALPRGFGQEATKPMSTAGEQQKRLELMTSRGPEGSLTILPVVLAGRPFDRVSEIVGVLLEQQGLKHIELSALSFSPAMGIELASLADSLGAFVRKHPVTTDYMLYAEFNGNREIGLVEIRAVVVDSAGRVVWMDRQGDGDAAMQRLESKEPMTFAVLLVERLCPALGLNDETAKAATPGPMARRMEERSGIPPESERTPLEGRQKLLKEIRASITLAVYPSRIGDSIVSASATELASMISGAGLCRSVPAGHSPVLKSSKADPNELKILWDLAREFREYTRKHPPDADYVLYADYAFNPERWEQGFVHFVVCDRKGEWVIVDLQNSHQPDYQNVKPKSREDCNKLLVRRLEGYLH